VNLALAAPATLADSGALPLSDFVNLYVHLRHPHHHDPATWPLGIWIAFAWPIVCGLGLLRGQARRIFIIFMGMVVIALIGAGIWYFSETLVQMSLYRFSIYPQLLGCGAAGTWIALRPDRKRMAAVLGIAGCWTIAAVCVIRGPFFGIFRMPQDDANYVALCRWVAQHTPVDAVLLVPPDEQSMRLIGKRAIVVNYKAVPQLSTELVQWRQRMCDVLDMDDLTKLPRGYAVTLAAVRQRYDSLSLAQHVAAAQKYGARYIVYADETGRYMLYDRGHP
jgi:hypothetical protein